ncbi:MAG: DUF255 domain-containing protein [Chloroflexi bacterium]|nr:DUF255 domain-containing protein [Chloroflexota bacterium]
MTTSNSPFRFSVRTNRANEVDWHEWGFEPFERARAENKPVALFLTAFWCGFCQRLDETTLSNDEVIALLNAFFIPIRVEDAERPDVDLRYNQDGWPTIAFITPDGDHLFSVNHMAPEPFINVLVRTITAVQSGSAPSAGPIEVERSEVAARAANSDPVEKAPLRAHIVGEIAGILEGLADSIHGGYSDNTGNKYLHAEANDFLLYLYEVSHESVYLDHVTSTLQKMRESRTFDAREGGFFRYSSKPDWREPHPEKLLTDQVTLLRSYLRAYVVTGSSPFRETANELIEYLGTTLTDSATGAFFGCQDYVRPEGLLPRGPSAGPPECYR